MPELPFPPTPEPHNRLERRHQDVLDASPRAFSVAETARRLTVSRDAVYRLLDEGRLRSVSIGRRRVIPASALAALLDEAIDHTDSAQ